MKNFTSYLSFALMLTIVGIVLFHTWIWPCGNGTETPSASNTVDVTTTEQFDTTQHKIERENIEPVAVVYRNRPFLPPVPINVPSELVSVPAPTASVLTSGNTGTLKLTKGDTAAIVGLYLRQVMYYSDTPELPDTADVALTINDSIGANRIVYRSILVKNLRPVSVTNVNSYYADRFMVFPGLQFGGITDFQHNQFKPMAGLDIAFKFKTNTNVRIGYMVGPDIQLYTIGVSQLLRFKKLGDMIRTGQLNRKIKRGLITL